ncbi:MAG: hypothetical protein HQK52_02155 [Oligoflexia bacterium]|nr:hypothetical protein [Oligoflexia bacterium]
MDWKIILFLTLFSCILTSTSTPTFAGLGIPLSGANMTVVRIHSPTTNEAQLIKQSETAINELIHKNYTALKRNLDSLIAEVKNAPFKEDKRAHYLTEFSSHTERHRSELNEKIRDLYIRKFPTSKNSDQNHKDASVRINSKIKKAKIQMEKLIEKKRRTLERTIDEKKSHGLLKNCLDFLSRHKKNENCEQQSQ